MDVVGTRTDHSLAWAMALSLVLFCGILALGGLQILNQHQNSVSDHMRLLSQSVLQNVESALGRGQLEEKDGALTFNDHSLELLSDFEQYNDLRFTGLLDLDNGRVLLSHSAICPDDTLIIPPFARGALQKSGEWSGPADCGDQKIYAAAKRLKAPLSAGGDSSLQTTAFLLVGLNTAQHNTIDENFREALLGRVLYLMVASLLCWTAILLFIKRRRQMHRVAALERFQAALLDSLPEGLLIISPDGTIQAANPAAERIFKRNPEALINSNVESLPGDLPLYPPGVQDPDCGPDLAHSWTQHKTNGAELEVLTLPMPVQKNCEEGHSDRLMIVRDRTELKKLEKSLMEAEQLAAAGTLAAGLAHEIRNPLSAMRGFAQYFQKKFAGSQPDGTYAATMMHEADRLSRVVGDLLYLAKPQEVSPIDVHLNSLVGDIRKLLDFELKKAGIALTTDLRAETVSAGADALERALLNLVLNGLEALKDSGRPDKKLVVRSRPVDGGVLIEVEDNGSGMSEAQRLHLFEPFHSGKEGGTGLGLLLVRKTMQDHGGKIEIESLLGQGTRITLFFPRPAVEKGLPKA